MADQNSIGETGSGGHVSLASLTGSRNGGCLGKVPLGDLRSFVFRSYQELHRPSGTCCP